MRQPCFDTIDAKISGGRTGLSALEKEALRRARSFRVREIRWRYGEVCAWVRAEMLRRAGAFVTVVSASPAAARRWS